MRTWRDPPGIEATLGCRRCCYNVGMSKRFKGKTCVYCVDALSTAGDHVFAREFFLKADRGNLPQVPACDGCNGAKSRLEHYLTALLPFGGRHPGAKDNLERVPGRLAKNPKLHETLARDAERTWSKEGGIYRRTMTLPVDTGRINDLFALIVRGLVWFHWETLLTEDHFVEVLSLTDTGENVFDEQLFKLNAANHVERNLGDGTVCYEGKQGVDQPEITVWRISMYGGLKFGDGQSPAETSSRIGAMTGPKSVLQAVARAVNA
jgi:hypothetical protein